MSFYFGLVIRLDDGYLRRFFIIKDFIVYEKREKKGKLLMII